MNGEARYIVVVPSDARPSSSRSSLHVVGTVLSVGVLGAFGLLMYLLLRSMGRGGQASGTGSRGETATVPTLPSRPRDVSRLSFVMTQPTTAAPSLVPRFHSRGEGVDYSLDEMITRVKAGGRDDLTLVATGDVREGAWQSARDQVTRSGLKIWSESGVAISGNGRGEYGDHRRYS